MDEDYADGYMYMSYMPDMTKALQTPTVLPARRDFQQASNDDEIQGSFPSL